MSALAIFVGDERDPLARALRDAAGAFGVSCLVVEASAVDGVASVLEVLDRCAGPVALAGVGACAAIVACAAGVDGRAAACVLVPDGGDDDGSVDRDQTAELAANAPVPARVDVLARARRIVCPTLIGQRANQVERGGDACGSLFAALTCVRRCVRGSDALLAAEAIAWIAAAVYAEGGDDVDAIG
ncbi:MAG TPA: hypothetical protein VGO62_07960, partial [Myxococcota bacterium]